MRVKEKMLINLRGVVTDNAIGAGGHGFIPRSVKSNTVANGPPPLRRSLKLCCPGAKLRYGLHYLLHVSASYCNFNVDLILEKQVSNLPFLNEQVLALVEPGKDCSGL